jgi:hypothetical protein
MRQGSAITIRATPDHRTLVRFERADGAYLIDGPFSWPSRDVERPLDRRWRRTFVAAAPDGSAKAMDFEWLSAAGDERTVAPCFEAGAPDDLLIRQRRAGRAVLSCRRPRLVDGRTLAAAQPAIVAMGTASSYPTARAVRAVSSRDLTGRVHPSQRRPGCASTVVADTRSAVVAPISPGSAGRGAGRRGSVRDGARTSACLSLREIAEGSSSLDDRLGRNTRIDGHVIGARRRRPVMRWSRSFG